ncbi:MAG: phosphoglucosamine mutase [Candidatus Poribacteria bacterium]|nr:phosphoglucosamine mutase [Candidatus Poribacteria bacterium]MDP6997266.1 phosphoglucosamine mutase [Candidatus Poribacteria bacterium]
MKDLMVSVSGVRGIVGHSLTPEVATRFATAFGTFIAGGMVIVGRDSRTSSPMLFHAVCAGLMASGCQILDVGMCPTPTVLLVSKKMKADGSIVITASHNPIEWNGLEFAADSGRLLTTEDQDQLSQIYQSDSIRFSPWNEQGRIEVLETAIEIHLEQILNCHWVNLERTHRRNLKVVIDAGNGAGSQISPILLEKLGCEVVQVHCTPDGLFPRPSEPTPEALIQLCKVVKAESADLGLAHDGDADRLVIVDQQGNALSSEYTFVLIADFMLGEATKFTPDPTADWPLQGTSQADLVATVSTSRMIDDVANRHNANLFRVPVGVGFVVEKMRQRSEQEWMNTGRILGGEGTGGVIFPELQYTTDGITAIAAIVQMLADSNQSISHHVEALPQYAMHKMKIDVPSPKVADQLLDSTAEIFATDPEADLDLTDGVKRIWSDRWVNIRKSGTEPVIRIFSEAPSQDEAKQLCLQISESLNKLRSIQ